MVELKRKISAPVWLDSIESKNRGLDLLGLRLPVQSIGNFMMNGITTATPAVRNLSLRTWLIWSYLKARNPDNWADFWTYSACAEACIAFGNVLSNSGALGVVGSDEAKEVVRHGEDTIEMAPLVARLAVQIYASPSEELGLSFTGESDIPGLTEERGVVLAELVTEAMCNTQIGRRLSDGDTLKNAHREELMEFGAVASLSAFEDGEVDGLVNAIMPAVPFPEERNRLSTYTSLLRIADQHERVPTEADFFEEVSAVNSRLSDSLLSCRNGWQRYLIRDGLAVCHEATLAAVISGIEHLQSNPSSTVLRDDVIRWVLVQSVAERAVMDNLGIELPTKDISEWTINEIADAIDRVTGAASSTPGLVPRWPGALQDWQIEGLVKLAGSGAPVLLPIIWLLARRRASQEIDEQVPEAQYAYRSGFGRIGLKEVIFPELERFLSQNWRYIDVVGVIVQRTVDQHLRIAWSRLGSEHPPRDVAVLTSDGQRWCFRKTFNGGRTASRINQALSWLKQLGLLDENGITATGKKVLDRSLDVLEASK